MGTFTNCSESCFRRRNSHLRLPLRRIGNLSILFKNVMDSQIDTAFNRLWINCVNRISRRVIGGSISFVAPIHRCQRGCFYAGLGEFRRVGTTGQEGKLNGLYLIAQPIGNLTALVRHRLGERNKRIQVGSQQCHFVVVV